MPFQWSKQHISNARAFLKDAPIIILDEPTSALDAESEHQIQAVLETLSKGRICSSLPTDSAIQHADRISFLIPVKLWIKDT